MACIKKRRGKWVIDYRDVTGRRRWETVQRTRKDAEERLAKIVGSGYKVVNSKRTFEDYAKEWMVIQQGENLPYIRDQLGHFSIQMTVDIYGHLVPGGNRQAVDKLDDEPSGEPSTESGSKTVADDPQGKAKYV